MEEEREERGGRQEVGLVGEAGREIVGGGGLRGDGETGDEVDALASLDPFDGAGSSFETSSSSGFSSATCFSFPFPLTSSVAPPFCCSVCPASGVGSGGGGR